MAYQELLVEKLLKMNDYLEQLQKIQPETYQIYLNDLTARYASERIIQLVVDLALDINNIILAHLKKPPASDYFSSFIELSDCHVLNPSFALKIAPSTGLRNRLVHEYEQINNEIVYTSIKRMIDLYGQYMKAIRDYINKK